VSRSSINLHFLQPFQLHEERELLFTFRKELTFDLGWAGSNDTIKRLMSYPKCRSVKVINNPAWTGSNHREVNYINYKQ
jgi:hypothetical protein